MSMAIKELLLIEEPTVLILKDELMKVAGWFVLPSFVVALCLEYFGEMKFGEVVKKLILILSFIGCFYTFHTKAVELSFQGSEEILKKVSPRNIFLKNWMDVKVRTKTNNNWSILEKFAIPNMNDLLGTFFFVVSKLFIWILKLVFTTVYHLTYVFAPLTAVLYFFPITKSSIAGTIQSSLWCIFMPFVLVSILAIVGNSIQAPAATGNLSIITIDQILWLFGVTLLLLMSPVLTLGLLRGGGVAMSGSAIGVMMSSAGMKVLSSTPALASGIRSASKKASSVGAKALLEPSIKDMLKKEKVNSFDKKKLGLVNNHGGLKNPFKSQKNLDERLEKAGITRNEASDLSRVPFGNSKRNESYSGKSKYQSFASADSNHTNEGSINKRSFGQNKKAELNNSAISGNKISDSSAPAIKTVNQSIPKVYNHIANKERLIPKNSFSLKNIDKRKMNSLLRTPPETKRFK